MRTKIYAKARKLASIVSELRRLYIDYQVTEKRAIYPNVDVGPMGRLARARLELLAFAEEFMQEHLPLEYFDEHPPTRKEQ